MSWRSRVRGNPLAWLCERDPVNPSVRYHALRDLLDRPADDPDVLEARAAIMTDGPVPAILAAQHPDGYWRQPGSGYGKYRGTVWQIMFLGELGARSAIGVTCWRHSRCSWRWAMAGIAGSRRPHSGS